MKVSQGASANREGNDNKATIKDILFRAGFEFIQVGSRTRWEACLHLIKEQDAPRFGDPPFGMATENPVICTSVFGLNLQVDFLLFCPHWKSPLALATRLQNSDGSAKDRIECLFSNIVEKFPCPCIVSLDGSEVEPVAMRGRELRDRSQGKLAAVFDSLGEFRRWVSGGCVYPASPQTLGV